jgi:L-asparaginase
MPDSQPNRPQLAASGTQMNIKFLTTGGTIDKVYFDARSEFEVGPPQVLEIVKDARVTFEYEIESILRKDSLDMTDEDRNLIRQRVEIDACARIVVTHGTDTMVATARALIGIPGKTIVLTGSMQPARFRVTDAVFNIGTAIGAVQSLGEGVYIAMNGQVFNPTRTRKNLEGNCFEEA